MPLALVTGTARERGIVARLRQESPHRRTRSPAGRWVSGQLLHADGGSSARY